MNKCPYCGAEYPDEVKVCSTDGELLVDWSPRARIDRLLRRYGERKKQPKGIRPSIQILMAVVIFAIGFAGFYFAITGVIDGKVYFLSRYNTFLVPRETHPRVFWGCTAFWAVEGIVMTGLGFLNIREAYRRIKNRPNVRTGDTATLRDK